METDKEKDVKKKGEWIVRFLNEATDEQILHLFQASIDETVRKDIEKLLLNKKTNNPKS